MVIKPAGFPPLTTFEGAGNLQGKPLPGSSILESCEEFPAEIKVGSLKLADIAFEMQTVSHALGTNEPAINSVLEPTEMTGCATPHEPSPSEPRADSAHKCRTFKTLTPIITERLTSPPHNISPFAVEKKSKGAEITRNPNYSKYM